MLRYMKNIGITANNDTEHCDAEVMMLFSVKVKIGVFILLEL